jgi:hypothetical protein
LSSVSIICPSPVHCRIDSLLHHERQDTTGTLYLTNHKFSYVRDGPLSAVAIHEATSQQIPSVVDTTTFLICRGSRCRTEES